MITHKTFKLYFLLLLCFSLTSYAQKKQTKPLRGKALSKAVQIHDSRMNGGKPLAPMDIAAERDKLLFEQTKNPNTGKIPDQIREKELQFCAKLGEDTQQNSSMQSQAQAKSASKNDFSYWENRGPFNV